MKRKKSLLITMALLMVAAILLSGCVKTGDVPGGTGDGGATRGSTGTKVDTAFPLMEAARIKVITPLRNGVVDHSEMRFFQELEQKTNVLVEWEHYLTSAWPENKSLIFASNMLPDAFAGQNCFSAAEIVNYGAQGYFVPLEDMIDDYAPNVAKIFNERPDFAKELTTPDGHIYSLFIFNENKHIAPDTLCINNEWLTKLGLSIPTTTDEFYNVLKAFKDGDPNENGKPDELPFVFRHNVTVGGLFSMFGSFGILDSGSHLTVRDGKVLYAAIEPEYRQGITYFSKLFQEGLADPESLTHSSNVYSSKTRINDKSKRVAGAFLNYNLLNAFNGDPDNGYVVVPPLAGPDGTRLWRIIPPEIERAAAFAISSSTANKEIILAWIDQTYDEKTSFEIKQGFIDTRMTVNADGKYEYLKAPEGLDELTWRYEGINSQFTYCLWKRWTDKLVKDDLATFQDYQDETYLPFKGNFVNFSPLFTTEEESDEIAMIDTDLKNYVNDTIASWLLKGGAEDDSQWNAYIKKCEEMGVRRLIELQQKVYDRLK